ncbi:uncharacterized protein KGF55_000012 [Candida pseudojiufengensis]|uniref:uncharacterized protein n=1 Tax=Candida pseudojiufengensis TaxID=497109 RepID=UPI0022250EDA|nr:uncharacterized protein KGF55_000012 [Candida pseudojiufengensis]KAI5968165.1 hypothetical protein KGF55_000012 [Candida pseudojiufengensis]
MFDNIETYLLQRIFEDLEPQSFDSLDLSFSIDNNLKLQKSKTTNHVKFNDNSTNTKKHIPPRRKSIVTSTSQIKNQIKLYNKILKLLEPFETKLDDTNYKIAILYLEDQILHPKKSIKNIRTYMLDIIYYIYKNIDDEQPLNLREIENTLHYFMAKRDQFDLIISDLNYFEATVKSEQHNDNFNNIKKSKLLILRALAYTYAFEKFQYPHISNKIDNLESYNYRILLNQLSPYYFLWALDENLTKYKYQKAHKKQGSDNSPLISCTLPLFEEVAIKFCELNTETNVDSKIMEIFDAISLSQLSSDEILPKFNESFTEYLKWLKVEEDTIISTEKEDLI